MRRVIFNFVGWVLLACGPLHAWNDTGHKVVGLIAYERLSPVARKAADELLAAHPHYESLLLKDLPAGADPKRWVFLQAATWPDKVRPTYGPNKKPDGITKYHHSDWHYINLPYVWPADAAQFPTAQPQGGGLLNAIAAARTIVGDKTRPKADRAVHLAWLLHLIGDLHQPLHSSAMYSARTPKGDQGGNLIGLRRANSVVNLHTYWDGALGTGESMPFLTEVVKGIRTAYFGNLSKALPELQRATTPEAWVKESYAASVETVYKQGRLKWRVYDEWSKRAETGVKAEEFPAIDPDYAISARELARRRAALAGVRLSDVLNEILR